MPKSNDEEINIRTKKPEFFEWKWIGVEELTKVAVPFKMTVYKKLQIEIKNILKNLVLTLLKVKPRKKFLNQQ